MKIDTGHMVDNNGGYADADYGGVPSGMQALVRRQVSLVGGAMLLIAVVFCALSMLFWNAADPSLSHATTEPVTNLMGRFGAILADLLVQFFGLSAFFILAIAGFGSYALIRGHRWTQLPRRLALAPIAVLTVAMLFSTIARPSSWPLPSGLGGVFGDLMLGLPGLFFGGYPTGVWGFLIGLVLIAPACVLMGIACGYGWRDEDSDDDTQGALMGAVMHALYSSKAAVNRALFKKRGTPSKPKSRRAIPDDVAGVRVEPDLDIFVRDDPVATLEDASVNGEYVESDTQQASRVSPPSIGTPVDVQTMPSPTIQPEQTTSRVVAAAAPPKPSARVHRDAQPSLINDGSFELPSVHLLDEPKNIVRDASLTEDALEQNARLLE
ncbi:MAG: DNA translocase FtsK 4TM domain-containing protein, partial [Pseudomonadota bacterium]